MAEQASMTPHIQDVTSRQDMAEVKLYVSYKFTVSFLQFSGADLQPRARQRSGALSRHRPTAQTVWCERLLRHGLACAGREGNPERDFRVLLDQLRRRLRQVPDEKGTMSEKGQRW